MERRAAVGRDFGKVPQSEIPGDDGRRCVRADEDGGLFGGRCRHMAGRGTDLVITTRSGESVESGICASYEMSEWRFIGV